MLDDALEASFRNDSFPGRCNGLLTSYHIICKTPAETRTDPLLMQLQGPIHH